MRPLSWEFGAGRWGMEFGGGRSARQVCLVVLCVLCDGCRCRPAVSRCVFSASVYPKEDHAEEEGSGKKTADGQSCNGTGAESGGRGLVD